MLLSHTRLNTVGSRLVAMTMAGSLVGGQLACTGDRGAPKVAASAQPLSDTERQLASLLTVSIPLGADSHCASSPRTDIPTIAAITGRFSSSPNVDDLAHSNEHLSLSGWQGGQVVITCEYFRTGADPTDPHDGWSGGGGLPGVPGVPPLDPPCAVRIPYQPPSGTAYAMLLSYINGPDLMACTPDQPTVPDCSNGGCGGDDGGGGGGGGGGDGSGSGSGSGGGPIGGSGSGAGSGGGGINIPQIQRHIDELQGALIDFDVSDDEIAGLASDAARGDAVMAQRLAAVMRQVAAENREHQRDPAYVTAARARNQMVADHAPKQRFERGNPVATATPRELLYSDGVEGMRASDAPPPLAAFAPRASSTETSSIGNGAVHAALPPGAACAVCGGAILTAIGALLIAIGDSMYLPHVHDPDAKTAKWISVIGAWVVAAGALLLTAECLACPPFVAAMAYVAQLVADLTIIGLYYLFCILGNIFGGGPRVPC